MLPQPGAADKQSVAGISWSAGGSGFVCGFRVSGV